MPGSEILNQKLLTPNAACIRVWRHHCQTSLEKDLRNNGMLKLGGRDPQGRIRTVVIDETRWGKYTREVV